MHTLSLAAQVGFYHLICKLEWLFCFFVLVLSGVELVFPTGCVMGLCFGCALETALITQACFSCCWAVLTQCQGLSCCSPHSTSEEAGGTKIAWRGHNQDSCPQLTKGILHLIWHHAQHIKLRESEEWGGA